MVINYTKKALKSKTNWFNIIVAVFGVLELNAHLLQNFFGDKYGFVFIGVAMVGVVLRSLTSTAIKDK